MTVQAAREEITNLAREPSSNFAQSMAMLELHRREVPKGWLKIYDSALINLRAVQCAKRRNIKLVRPTVLDAEMQIGVDEECCGLADPVVSGVLQRLRKQSMQTCERCGRHGARPVEKAWETYRLCARCEVVQQIQVEWKEWITLLSFGDRGRKQESVVELQSLPATLRTLIPRERIRTLATLDHTVKIHYLTKDDLREYLPMMERVLAHVNDSG